MQPPHTTVCKTLKKLVLRARIVTDSSFAKFSMRLTSMGCLTLLLDEKLKITINACSYGGRSKGGIWYSDIPSPNTTVFSVLWPPSVALWGSLVLPYTLVVR